MKHSKKYGEAAKRHAVNLRLISRFSYAEIEEQTGIPAGYVRKLVYEETTSEVTGNAKSVTENIEPVTHEVTSEKQAENAQEAPKNEGADVTMFGKVARHFSLMHLVFYATTVTGCYAIFDTLPNVIGIALLTVFALFSLDSVLKAQDSARPQIAEYGRNRVVASELVAAVFHYTVLNKYLWANKAMLPFEIKLLPPEGGNFVIDFRGQILNGVWHNGESIFYISIVISFLLFSAAFAAVDSVLRENRV